MTVAYAYFRYLIDRENHKSIVYYFEGPTDVKLIGDDNPSREDWNDMEKRDKVQDIAPVEKNDIGTSVEVKAEEETHTRYIPDLKKMKNRTSCEWCAKIIYITLIVLSILICLGVIVMSMLTCIATKVYDTEQSHRLVGMVILAVTSAVTISMCIYAAVAVFKKQSRPIHATTVVLIIVALIQALILGVSVKVTQRDEVILGQSLSESFRLAKEDNPRHVKLWSATQSDLNCCGLYGPADYHTLKQPSYFPPNVPISCCPTYDRERSALVQERDREICKAKKTYYDVGCRRLIINIFKGTADVMLNVTVALIVIEIIIALIGGCCLNKRKHVTKIEVITDN